MNKRKKVKFWDHESTRTQRIRSPVVGDAKTSEYRSFQKLLEKSHFNELPRYDNDSRNLDANDERNDHAATKFYGKRSISPALVVTPIAQRPFSSTNTSAQKFDLKDNVRCKHTTNSIQTTIQKGILDPWGSSFSPGPENKYKEIFSSKRENLLKLAAGTLTRKADEIISNKSNSIQECLQRLSTRQKSANLDEISKPMKKASCARYHSKSSMRSPNKVKTMQDLQGRSDIYSTVERKHDQPLFDQYCNRADELFPPIFPKLRFISYSDAGEPEFSTKYNTRGHIPLKVPTLQPIQCYSDSMLDEEKHYKSSSNRYSHKFRYRRELEEQQIVPYSNSNISYNVYDHDISPKFPKEQDCNFPLLEFNDTNTNPEYSEELDSLPLALYNDHNTLNQIENSEAIDFFGKKNIFGSLPIGNFRECLLDGEESDDGSSWHTTRNRYDGRVNKNEPMEIERYLSPKFSSSWHNFAMARETSFFDFCPAPETSFFDLLSVPETTSWHDL